ncbi:MAG TPA: hypothetical protein VK721_14300 [Solirubrobacteraceae bacterium]|jgi:hypothetical protein|nr:hypothetical protein [Solirubrobacteraceae bacterium]
MSAVREITTLDRVELTEPVGDVPAGARGGVLELRDGGMAMLEITSLPQEPVLDRIVVAPLTKLRLVG